MARERGMSLIELLIAMGILAMVILSIVGLFSQSVSLNATGRDYTTVNSLARDRLEELVSLPFNDPQLTVPAGTMDVSFPDDLTDADVVRTYKVRELRLQKTDEVGTPDQQLATPIGGGNGNIKEITVTVQSKRPLFGFRDVTVTTLKVDGLLQ